MIFMRLSRIVNRRALATAVSLSQLDARRYIVRSRAGGVRTSVRPAEAPGGYTVEEGRYDDKEHSCCNGDGEPTRVLGVYEIEASQYIEVA
jgi:hypothetical protein